jgi:hypothetical protein
MGAGGTLGERVLVDHPRFRAWLLYPPEKVLKNQLLDTIERASEISIMAARSENEPFLLVLRPRGNKPLLDIRFEWRPVRAPHGPDDLAITLSHRSIGYIYIDQPSGASVLPDRRDRYKDEAVPFGSTGKTGYFPDRLAPESKSPKSTTITGSGPRSTRQWPAPDA